MSLDAEIQSDLKDEALKMLRQEIAALRAENTKLREIAGELGKAGLPFKQMADKFDDPRYRDEWPNETRLSGDGIGVLRNNTIQLHNFLTLGDCRKLKATLARWTEIEGGKTKVICDGCNVRQPFEHRCHGEHAQVQGERVNKPCECPECTTP